MAGNRGGGLALSQKYATNGANVVMIADKSDSVTHQIELSHNAKLIAVDFADEKQINDSIKTIIAEFWNRRCFYQHTLLNDEALTEAAKEIAIDVYEANYGGGVVKKRVANKGRGKSGSTRTIVAFKKGRHCFFVFGFDKNAKSNILFCYQCDIFILLRHEPLYILTTPDIGPIIRSYKSTILRSYYANIICNSSCQY